jgi:hypothetical protein
LEAKGSKRATSMARASMPGSPSTIQRASTCPMAPPWEKPAMHPQAAQKFRSPGTGPTSGFPSGVKVKAPLTHLTTTHDTRAALKIMHTEVEPNTTHTHTHLRTPTLPRAGKRRKPIMSSGAMRSMSSGSSSMPKSQGGPPTSQCRGSRSYNPSSTPFRSRCR